MWFFNQVKFLMFFIESLYFCINLMATFFVKGLAASWRRELELWFPFYILVFSKYVSIITQNEYLRRPKCLSLTKTKRSEIENIKDLILKISKNERKRMLNKYSIGLIVLISTLASLMEVNALNCYQGLNVTADALNVEQLSGFGSPKSGTCSDLEEVEGLTAVICRDDAPGCYIYNNKYGSVDFGCGLKTKCDAKKNCCEGDLCNCHDE